MKTSGIAVAAALVLALGPRAQDPGRQGAPGGGRGGFPGIAIFNALDTDHDQTLSASEIDAAPSVLRQLDRNGDGALTLDELFAGRGGPGRGDGRGRGGSGVGDEAPAAPPTPDDLVATLMAFDKNHDGKLTKDEVPARLQGLFARVDADGDGVITPDEIRKAAEAQPQPAAAGGRGGEGRRGEGGREGGPPRDPLFSALDLNGDGTLSADEIAAAPASLRKLDTNGDGVLSFAEVFGTGRGRG